MFLCDKCGLCCMTVGTSPIYKELDRGDGICIYFDDNLKLCNIYDNRPIVCNIDEIYSSFFSDKMSKEDYYKINYESCELLKNYYLRR